MVEAVAKTKKITIEVEVPEGLEWLGGMAEEVVRRLVAYALLQAKASGKVDEEELIRAVEEAKARVWERVKHAYAGG